jgi:hypothetical protein
MSFTVKLSFLNLILYSYIRTPPDVYPMSAIAVQETSYPNQSVKDDAVGKSAWETWYDEMRSCPFQFLAVAPSDHTFAVPTSSRRGEEGKLD